VSLGKTLNAVSRCGGPAWRKTCKQNSFCVGVLWRTQSIQHLVETKKKPWPYRHIVFRCQIFQFSRRSFVWNLMIYCGCWATPKSNQLYYVWNQSVRQ